MTVLFLICGGLTNYTGKVLAKIMSKEPGLKTYSDIGAYAFGANARLVVSLLFCLELWAVSVGELRSTFHSLLVDAKFLISS